MSASPARFRGGRLLVQRRACRYRRVPDPSPAEIAERCAQVRAGWTAETWQERARPEWRCRSVEATPTSLGVLDGTHLRQDGRGLSK